MNIEIVFIKNQKGGELLLWNGYKHNYVKSNKNGSSLWRCTERDECAASITLDVLKQNILRESTHVCRNDFIKYEIKMKLSDCKRRVCENLGPIQQIFEDTFLELKELGKGYLPEIPLFPSVKSSLYRERKKHLAIDNLVFKTREEVKISENYKKSFLIANDGTDDKILIFASKLATKTIKSYANKNGNYYGDGTFAGTVHLDVKSTEKACNVVPIVFALLPDKSEMTYIRFFKLLYEELGINVTNYKCDCEQAQINAVKQTFPRANITICFYYFNKAVHKKGKELQADTTRTGTKVLNYCALFPLLPAANFAEAWSSVLEIPGKTSQTEDFLRYFKRQWYPRLPPAMLSCSEQRFRTKNALEGWHRLDA